MPASHIKLKGSGKEENNGVFYSITFRETEVKKMSVQANDEIMNLCCCSLEK